MLNALEFCAIIPTYRPDLDFPSRLELVARQVGRVIIVDDSGSPTIALRLDAMTALDRNLYVIHNEHNRGLAASLNHGFREAKRLGYRWLLTLDDDTIIAPDMCRQLAERWATLSQSLPVGVLAMSWAPVGVPAKRQRRDWRDKRMVITSGSLTTMDTLDRVGPFREEFIIDAVDSDFCLRVRAHGLRVIKDFGQGFTQRLGTPRIVEWGPWRITLFEHSPTRTYYRIRNSTRLIMEYWRQEPLYLAGALFCDLQQFLAVLFFYERKKEQLTAMAEGFMHACKGIFGFRVATGLNNECISANN